MSEITRRPTTVGSAVAVVAAVVALAASASSTSGLVFGFAGVGVVTVGVTRGRRRAVDIGALALFLGVVTGGLAGGSVEATLLGTVGTVLAWDCGQSAVDLGEQLGREADTWRLEAVHAGSSLLVGLASATIGYAAYVVAGGGQPVAAVVLLLTAAILVTIGLGTDRVRRDGARR
ncbi:hypothetical protein ACFOZ7_04850 [Natribaculum luteum]|uniref:DUF1275 domain-containing protein n=1 Tax=Natribaculum luteum TaxID=1586232 RepID=A0ABD5NW77_9EURY|nr:hypothetical protein [Natribaculum luteum]